MFGFASQHVGPPSAAKAAGFSTRLLFPGPRPRRIVLRPRASGESAAPRRCGRGVGGGARCGASFPWLPYIPARAEGGAEVVVTYLWQERNLLIMVAKEMRRLFRKCRPPHPPDPTPPAYPAEWERQQATILTACNRSPRLCKLCTSGDAQMEYKGKAVPRFTHFSWHLLLLGDALGSGLGHGGGRS